MTATISVAPSLPAAAVQREQLRGERATATVVTPLGPASAYRRHGDVQGGACGGLASLLNSLHVAALHDRIDGEPRATDEYLWTSAHARLPHLIPARPDAAPHLLLPLRRAYDAGYDGAHP